MIKYTRIKLTPDIKWERAKLAYQYYTLNGWTLQKIAHMFGLTSRERARQIIDEYMKRLMDLVPKNIKSNL